MERRSNLCSKFKLEGTNRSTKQMHDYKLKGSSWEYPSSNYDHNNIVRHWKDGDLVAAGFSWPPRSYTCSFCKREFRSAQALGGHMNVHRRDRARLRLSPSSRDNNNNHIINIDKTLNLDLNPSLSSNPNFSSLFTRYPRFASTLPPIRPVSAETKGLFGIEKFGSSGVKKGEFVRLDLEIGLISPSKDELDLELRLGYT